MAVNPMQRKARQSFLLGMLLMLVIAAIVVAVLYMSIMNLRQQIQTTEANSQTVNVLKNDIKSGQTITAGDIETKTIETSIAKTEIVQKGDITENTIAKIDLGKGTILTQAMITEVDETVENSLREQEYNMLLLPTDLETNDYIDIRLLFPNGQDYIVVSKKRVIQSSENTIFLKLTEDEIATMSNAIVESYMTTGSLLYANKYTDPGIQEASTPTYTVSKEVLDLVDSNPNITQTAKNALYTRYVNATREQINTVLNQNSEDAATTINDKLDTQIKTQQEERSRYIEQVGTDY